MEFAVGSHSTLSNVTMHDLAGYRHRVFVEKLQWQLNCRDRLEYDQFDRNDTVYLLAKNDDGHVVGCARLLPTTKSYLLSEIFPQLVTGTPPSSRDVWELSRFAAYDFNGQSESPEGQFSSSAAIAVLRLSLECAALHGAKKVITVSPLGVERLLRRAGFNCTRAGEPVEIGGEKLIACFIDCDTKATNFTQH